MSNSIDFEPLISLAVVTSEAAVEDMPELAPVFLAIGSVLAAAGSVVLYHIDLMRAHDANKKGVGDLQSVQQKTGAVVEAMMKLTSTMIAANNTAIAASAQLKPEGECQCNECQAQRAAAANSQQSPVVIAPSSDKIH